MEFEWNAAKATANERKHRVSFEEAVSMFLEPLAVSGPDPDQSAGESRYLTFGMSSLGRMIVVAHTHRSGSIRLISARRVTRKERKLYEQG